MGASEEAIFFHKDQSINKKHERESWKGERESPLNRFYLIPVVLDTSTYLRN